MRVMNIMNKFTLTEDQKKIVETIRSENKAITVVSRWGGKNVNLNAVALVQDLEKVINRSRELRGVA